MFIKKTLAHVEIWENSVAVSALTSAVRPLFRLYVVCLCGFMLRKVFLKMIWCGRCYSKRRGGISVFINTWLRVKMALAKSSPGYNSPAITVTMWQSEVGMTSMSTGHI